MNLKLSLLHKSLLNLFYASFIITYLYITSDGGDNMDIRNCAKCGKIYAYDGQKLCLKCRREEEVKFQEIKKYLYDNPDADIKEVSDATGVSVKKIMDYLRQGRLQLKGENSKIVLECENCGTRIITGKFCDRCAEALENKLKGATGLRSTKLKKRTGDKMYIADRYRD